MTPPHTKHPVPLRSADKSRWGQPNGEPGFSLALSFSQDQDTGLSIRRRGFKSRWGRQRRTRPVIGAGETRYAEPCDSQGETGQAGAADRGHGVETREFTAAPRFFYRPLWLHQGVRDPKAGVVGSRCREDAEPMPQSARGGCGDRRDSRERPALQLWLQPGAGVETHRVRRPADSVGASGLFSCPERHQWKLSAGSAGRCSTRTTGAPSNRFSTNPLSWSATPFPHPNVGVVLQRGHSRRWAGSDAVGSKAPPREIQAELLSRQPGRSRLNKKRGGAGPGGHEDLRGPRTGQIGARRRVFLGSSV